MRPGRIKTGPARRVLRETRGTGRVAMPVVPETAQATVPATRRAIAAETLALIATETLALTAAETLALTEVGTLAAIIVKAWRVIAEAWAIARLLGAPYL